jgi:hypothetical protein
MDITHDPITAGLVKSLIDTSAPKSAEIGQRVFFQDNLDAAAPLLAIGTSTYLRSGHVLTGAEATYPDAYAIAGKSVSQGVLLDCIVGPTVRVKKLFTFGETTVGVLASGALKIKIGTAPWVNAVGRVGIQELIFTGGVYHAICSSNTIYSSTDLNTWTLRYTAPTGTLSAICTDGAGILIASGSGRTVFSTDWGLSWTSKYTVGASCMFAQGLFVIGGPANGLYTTPDAVTWTTHVVPGQTQPLAEAIYAGGMFRATTGNGFMWSTTGATWAYIAPTPAAFSGAYLRILYDTVNSRMIVVSKDYATTYYGYSTNDGVSWTQASVAGTSAFNPGLQTYSLDNGVFIICGDLGMWTSSTMVSGSFTQVRSGVNVGLVKQESGFILGGTGGSIYEGTTLASLPLISGLPAEGPMTVAYGNGRWVIILAGGAWWSDDLTTFTPGTGTRPYVTGSTNYPCGYAHGRFYSILSNTFYYSLDGKAWLTSVMPIGSYSIAYQNGLFCAVGNSTDTCAYSSDGGLTWALSGSLNTQGASNAVMAGNGIFLALSNLQTSIISISTDCVTWQTQMVSSSSFIRSKAFFLNGFFYIPTAGGIGATVNVSPDGVQWDTTRETIFSNQMVNVAGGLAAQPYNNTWRLSTDGCTMRNSVAIAGTLEGMASDGNRLVIGGSTSLYVSSGVKAIGISRPHYDNECVAYMRIK